MNKKAIHTTLLIMLTLLMPLTGCGRNTAAEGYAGEADASSAGKVLTGEATADAKEYPSTADTLSEALTGNNAIQSFIDEPAYDGKIKDADAALDAVYSILEASEYRKDIKDIELDLAVVDGPSDDGNMFYTFRQVADDIAVNGAAVKLIADKDGKALGLVSNLVPGIKIRNDMSWRIDAAEAEAIVREAGLQDGITFRILPNATEQTLLPFEDDSSNYYYTWVVYTNNIYEEADTAYLAHYVDEAGNYLYSIPVMQPGDSDALSGYTAAFTFEGLNAYTWTGTVKKYHGETETVTIPVARDPESGDLYLADIDHRVICADYYNFWYEETLTPRKAVNGKFTDNEVLIYKAFLEIYDFYKTIGWNGPDGEGSPVLLLMDWIDEDGDPVHNACYCGKVQGFDTFQFNRDDPDGECYDTLAHEFTHALTTATMTLNIYQNDYGAINEGFSDIFGNLVEGLLGKTDDKTWLLQENSDDIIRSMSDPNKYEQPAYVWDRYYVPEANEATENNDEGGVHTNSSLLNLIAWRLNESGMDPTDQLYYWQNVSLVLTPRTDYKQIALILPWTMRLIGMNEYIDVLNDAIAETGISDNSLPDRPRAGQSRIQMIFPVPELLDDYEVIVEAYDPDSDSRYYSWPEAGTRLIAMTVNPGRYLLQIAFIDKETGETYYIVRTNDDWEIIDEDELEIMTEDGIPEEWLLLLQKDAVTDPGADRLKTLLQQ